MPGGATNTPERAIDPTWPIGPPREEWAYIAGSCDIAVRTGTKWVRWSTGPYIERDRDELREAGIPQGADIDIDVTYRN